MNSLHCSSNDVNTRRLNGLHLVLRLILALFTLQVAVGCTQTTIYRFRVFDASTMQPLAGVQVERNGFKRNLFTHYSEARDQQTLAPTDANGELVVENVDDVDWIQTFIFLHSGFQDAAIKNSYQLDGMIHVYLSPPSDFGGDSKVVSKKEGWFNLFLKPVATSQATSTKVDPKH